MKTLYWKFSDFVRDWASRCYRLLWHHGILFEAGWSFLLWLLRGCEESLGQILSPKINIAVQLDRKGIKGREDSERRGGGGHYSREAITLNISVKGGGGVNRRTAIIRRNTVTRDIYLSWTSVHLATSSPSSSRFPIWQWNIGKRDDRGDEVDLLGSVDTKQSIKLTSFFHIGNCWYAAITKVAYVFIYLSIYRLQHSSNQTGPLCFNSTT